MQFTGKFKEMQPWKFNGQQSQVENVLLIGRRESSLKRKQVRESTIFNEMFRYSNETLNHSKTLAASKHATVQQPRVSFSILDRLPCKQ